MYELYDHGLMLGDRVRVRAYDQALEQAVRPGSVVLDVGTGVGIMALLACRYGARRVYAVEPSDLIQLGRDLAVANGYADRIEFIQALSTQVTLPERVQVIVSDLRGVLPLFPSALPSIIDARTRFLAPQGWLIPRKDTLWAGVVEATKLFRNFAAPWNDDCYGLDLKVASRMATNNWRKAYVKPEQLLVAPQCWFELDYATMTTPPEVRGELSWSTARPGTGHGLILWFDSNLAPGVELSNAPSTSGLIYGQGFFPWPEPVELDKGDVVSVGLSAHLVGADYLWRWDTRIWTHGQPASLKANFKQSDFFGFPLSPSKLKQMRGNNKPTLNEDGQIDRLILELIDGERSLEEIALQVAAAFPRHFANGPKALSRVADLTLKYGRPAVEKFLSANKATP